VPDRDLVLQADAVHFAYAPVHGFRRSPARRGTDVLHSVDVTLRRGESLGIMGPNGSGKTTLLRVLAGVLTPREGRVRATHRPILLALGPALRGRLPVRDNIVLGLTALGLSRSRARSHVDDVLAFAELNEHAGKQLQALSSGMHARLQFSIATVIRPDILLLDELLSVGDAAFRRKSAERIDALRDAASAFVLVSHDHAAVQRLCDRAMLLRAGSVVYDGPVTDLPEQA